VLVRVTSWIVFSCDHYDPRNHTKQHETHSDTLRSDQKLNSSI
jgi:hypothetical protein